MMTLCSCFARRVKRRCGGGSSHLAPNSSMICTVHWVVFAFFVLRAYLLRCFFPQPLRVDVDDQRREQDQAADQDLQEAVDVDVVEAVIQDTENEQPDDGVADAAA